MSEDLIKRSDAVIVVYKALRTPPLKGVLTDTMSLAIELVHSIPSADRPQGEWIFDDPLRADFECSECLERSNICTPFCPNCGTRMKGADDEMLSSHRF